MTTETDKAALDRFLVDNPELHDLSAKLDVFNLFDVLRVADAEIRHSNVLAWLLDPAGNHGLGDAFLRRFLSRCLYLNQASGLVDVPLSAAEVELADLRSSEIRREYHHIDVLVLIPETRWAVLIENKIRASESPGQLRRYRQEMEDLYPGWRLVPVFLTPGGESPSESGQAAGYLPFSYEELAGILRTIMESARQLPDAIRLFIGQYLQTLERLTMSDTELVELCRKIYTRHRKAIDLIVEYGAVSQVGEIARQVLEEDKGLPVQILEMKSSTTWFIPTEWVDLLRPFSPGWSAAVPYGMACWFWHAPARQKLGLVIEVGPISPPQERKRLVQALDQAGFKVLKLAYRDEAKYTRIYTDHRRWPEEDKLEETIRTLWARGSKQARRVTEVLRAL